MTMTAGTVAVDPVLGTRTGSGLALALYDSMGPSVREATEAAARELLRRRT